jgi:putative ABC transport system permease protein
LNAFDRPSIDGTVLAFSAGLAILTGLGFGIVPAWLAGREDPVSALKAGVWRSTPAGARLRKTLVAGEIGLAVVLLIGAGLLLRTMANISKVPLGFDTHGILSFSVSLHGEPYISAETTTLRINSFYSGVLDRLRNLPGVTAVAAISIPPLENGRAEMLLPIIPDDPKVQPVPAAPRFASSGYFGVMGIPILKGRDFSSQDTRTSPSVVIVSRDLSDRLWPGEDPIGRKLHCKWDCEQPPIVIGIVAPGRRFGPRSEPLAEYYMDYLQRDWPYMTFLLRTQGDPAALTPAVSRAVAAIDPTQPVYEIETMQQKLHDNESLLRFQLFTLSVFAVFSVLLACIGLYGVISSTVTQRTREIGLRIALGARRGAIQASVLRETAVLALAGGSMGILASLALGPLLTTILFQMSPRDPLTFGAVTGLLIAIALLAGSIPARRAASVDPVEALRAE